MNHPAMHPVMSCAEARDFERAWFAGDTGGLRVRAAMRRAGAGVARETRVLLDEAGFGRIPIVVLCGKGRNAGDALIAAISLLDRADSVIVHLAFAEDSLAPESRAALDTLIVAGAGRVNVVFRKDGEISFPKGVRLVLAGLVGPGFPPTPS